MATSPRIDTPLNNGTSHSEFTQWSSHDSPEETLIPVPNQEGEGGAKSATGKSQVKNAAKNVATTRSQRATSNAHAQYGTRPQSPS